MFAVVLVFGVSNVFLLWALSVAWERLDVLEYQMWEHRYDFELRFGPIDEKVKNWGTRGN